MELIPDTTNVVYMDEYRQAKWRAELKRARRLGGVAVFNQEYSEPGQVIAFPSPEDEPDGAA
jgi:hypothetical protein